MAINGINRRVRRFSIFWSVTVGFVLVTMMAGHLFSYGRVSPWYPQTEEAAGQLAAELKNEAKTTGRIAESDEKLSNTEVKIDDTIYSGDSQRTTVPLSPRIRDTGLVKITILEATRAGITVDIYGDEAGSNNKRFSQWFSYNPALPQADSAIVLKILPGESLRVRSNHWKIKVEPVTASKPKTVFENLPIYAEWEGTGEDTFYYAGPGKYIMVEFTGPTNETVSYCTRDGCYSKMSYGEGYPARIRNDVELAKSKHGYVVTVRAKPGQTWRAWSQDYLNEEPNAAVQEEMQRQRESYRGDKGDKYG